MNEKCFARRTDSKCTILECGACHGNYNTCPFYKPKWKADHDRKLALKRIANMPPERQNQISVKYYQGQSPWMKEGL